MLKNANASRVTVTVAYGKSGVELTITDDGIGFDTNIPSQWDKDKGGFGLISMRERAQLLGGGLTIKSSLGNGTDVVAKIPAPPERAATPEAKHE